MRKFIVLRGEDEFPLTKQMTIIQVSEMPDVLVEKYPDSVFTIPVLRETGRLGNENVCYLLERSDFGDTKIIETFNSSDGTIVFAIV